MSQTAQTAITVIGIDIGKTSFHIVGQDERGCQSAPNSDSIMGVKKLHAE